MLSSWPSLLVMGEMPSAFLDCPEGYLFPLTLQCRNASTYSAVLTTVYALLLTRAEGDQYVQCLHDNRVRGVR